MSLQGTFNTAVQAMNTQSHNLSNISTNIANVNTTSYKGQDTHFETLLNEVIPTDKAFFAVKSVDFRNVDKQGTVATTGRAFDVAINGRGFFVTNPTTDQTGIWQYTRDGAFFGKAVDLGVDTDGNGVNDQGTQLTTSNGSYLYGWKADDQGNFTETNDITTLTPVVFSNQSVFPSKATTTMSLQANISAADSGRQVVGIPFVDASGTSRTLTVGFNAQLGNNAWTLDMSALDSQGQAVPVTFNPPSISFNSIGQIDPLTSGSVSVTVNDASGPQTFNLDLTKLTQYGNGGDLTVQNIDQDGYIAGKLDNTYFNSNGVLIGSYTNGEIRNLYKLPIATFAADNNLEARPGNIYYRSQEAGDLKLNSLGAGMSGTHVVVGALEASNVDLADQFSKMIVTQRAYSSAAKVLQTADEMTQAARDLKR